MSNPALLHLSVPGLQLCIALEQVEQILPLMAPKAVPNVPRWVLGLINYYGISIPLIDLAWRLGIEVQEELSIEAPIILCHYKNSQIALVVENVYGILRPPKKSIMMTDLFDDPTTPYTGVIHPKPGELAMIINLHQLLDQNIFSNPPPIQPTFSIPPHLKHQNSLRDELKQ
ncbi:chemotaxis protein CheW [Magnetococcales bacterium HHB-1]